MPPARIQNPPPSSLEFPNCCHSRTFGPSARPGASSILSNREIGSLALLNHFLYLSIFPKKTSWEAVQFLDQELLMYFRPLTLLGFKLILVTPVPQKGKNLLCLGSSAKCQAQPSLALAGIRGLTRSAGWSTILLIRPTPDFLRLQKLRCIRPSLQNLHPNISTGVSQV
jgi:hypothetical protein